jgi:hypothetical protein
MEHLTKLSWRARGTGAACTAHVNQPIQGFRVTAKYSRNAPGTPLPEGPPPNVDWITYDGAIYWVRLAAVRGWPRTIRVTQSDVTAGLKAQESLDAD